MLSDEERKAMESLKNIAIYMGDNYTFSQQGIRNLRENLRIVLPAIEKQSKEIEELKKYEEGYKLLNYSLDNYISKDKIKAKIEELREIKDIANILDKICIPSEIYNNVEYAIKILLELTEDK